MRQSNMLITMRRYSVLSIDQKVSTFIHGDLTVAGSVLHSTCTNVVLKRSHNRFY